LLPRLVAPDAIFCNQTVEHIHDLPRFFAAAHRALKPGGRMVIANDNNALNPKQLAKFSAMWALRDRSQDYIEQLKRERPIENADIEPYAVMRERMVREANPSLPADDVRRLADATAGLIEPDVRDVARRYAPGAALPTPPTNAWSRNPVTGEYCERQLNPFDLADEIRRAGFTSRVLHAFRPLPLRALNPVRSRRVSRRIFARRAVFVIRCVRV
jgi:SAM-dependent methyltransferase